MLVGLDAIIFPFPYNSREGLEGTGTMFFRLTFAV